MIWIESSYFEAYTFEDFDLNGDGYITREEFNEAKFPNCCGGNSMKFPTFGDWQRTVWIYAYICGSREDAWRKTKHHGIYL